MWFCKCHPKCEADLQVMQLSDRIVLRVEDGILSKGKEIHIRSQEAAISLIHRLEQCVKEVHLAL